MKGVGENTWVGNGLRFATAGEAINFCRDLQDRWSGCKGGAENRRAYPSDDPITHGWINGRLVTFEPGTFRAKESMDQREAQTDARDTANADRIDGYTLDDLGKSPDY